MTQASILTDVTEVEAIATEWDELALSGGTPFLTVAWLSAWWKSYRSGAIAVIVLRDSSGRLLAGATCRRVSRTTWEAAANLQSGNWDVVAVDGRARQQIWQLVASLAPSRLRLHGLVQDAASATLARRELTAAGYRVLSAVTLRSPYLQLPGSYELLLSSISRNLRSQVGRKLRGLERLGTVRLREVRGGLELADALKSLFELEGSGWKTREATAILSDPALHTLYQEFAPRAAECGWLRLYLLEVDGQPIAGDFGCSFAGVGYLLKTGFDESFKQYSPGLVLRSEVLRASIAEGLHGYDFLGGPDGYKLRWTTDIRPRIRLRAYRGVSTMAEWLYWSRGRPALKSVALRTGLRRQPTTD